jgi:hypothetical protein
MELWFRIPEAATWSNGSTDGSVFTRGSFAGSHGFIRKVANNTFGFWVRGDGGLGSADVIVARDTWYHAVGTWNGSTARLYINGSLSSSLNILLSGNFEPAVWFVGSTQALSGSVGNRFQGDVANLKIYNGALTDSEVQQNFNALRGRFGI